MSISLKSFYFEADSQNAKLLFPCYFLLNYEKTSQMCCPLWLFHNNINYNSPFHSTSWCLQQCEKMDEVRVRFTTTLYRIDWESDKNGNYSDHKHTQKISSLKKKKIIIQQSTLPGYCNALIPVETLSAKMHLLFIYFIFLNNDTKYRTTPIIPRTRAYGFLLKSEFLVTLLDQIVLLINGDTFNWLLYEIISTVDIIPQRSRRCRLTDYKQCVSIISTSCSVVDAGK